MQADVKKDRVFLKDEMEALLELTQKIETKEQSQIFDTIEVRKEMLKTLAAEMPERKDAIANEVSNLTHIVSKVLDEDYDGAVDELEARKEELLDIHNGLTNLQGDGDQAAKDAAAKKAADDKAAADKKAADDKAAADKAAADKAAAAGKGK